MRREFGTQLLGIFACESNQSCQRCQLLQLLFALRMGDVAALGRGGNVTLGEVLARRA